MSANPFLKLQLRLLITQFGRRNVMEALADATEVPFDQLEAEIARLASAKQSKPARREKAIEELVAALPPLPDATRHLVLELGRLYEAKLFLPNLRDAEEFLRRTGSGTKKHKSRKEALGPVLTALSASPSSELESLLAHSKSTQGKGDYALLASELMGKGQKLD